MTDDALPEDDDAAGEASDQPEQPAGKPLPPGTLHGSFRVEHNTAWLPESVGSGEFANALMVAAGPLEFILDFVQKLGEPARVVARVVMPPVVAGQFLQALRHNVGLYERQFGSLPALPRPTSPQTGPSTETADNGPDQPPSVYQGSQSAAGAVPGGGGGIVGAGLEPGDAPQPPEAAIGRPIQDIYDDLRLDDELLSGRYANAVIVRHTPAEFAFEFITRFMPHSAVSSRVIVAAPNIPSLMGSIEQALGDHQRRTQGNPGRGELPPPSEN